MKAFKLFATLIVVALTLGFASCKSGDNIPAGVYKLPANEEFDVDAAPGHLVILDFNAPWCGPCQRFTPIFEEAAKTYEGKVQFVEVNIDEHEALATKLEISSIPAVLFILPDGQKDWHVGLMTAEEFDGKIQAILNK